MARALHYYCDLSISERLHPCYVCGAQPGIGCAHVRLERDAALMQKWREEDAKKKQEPYEVTGRVKLPNGDEQITMRVSDPKVIEALEAGTRPDISIGYLPVDPQGLDESRIKRARREALTDFIGSAVTRGDIHGQPTPDDGKTLAEVIDLQNARRCPQTVLMVRDEAPARCRLPRDHEGLHEALVGTRGAKATWSEIQLDPTFGQMYTLHVPEGPVRLGPAPISGGSEGVVFAESIEEETQRLLAHLRENDPHNPLLRAHLRSEPMPDEPKKISSTLAWFKEQAQRALAVNPNITMMEFIDRVGEPEIESPIQKAFHLQEAEMEQALRNVGCDLRCGACAETFFTGSTDLVHRCAMLAKLKCILCEAPALPKSQLCADHERQEHDEIEGHIQANRELNGSSADTRTYAIAKMNDLEQEFGGRITSPEALCAALVVLLEVAGIRPDGVQSFLQFIAPQDTTDLREFGGLVVAHARGMVLALQLLREGPNPDAPSPLKPKSRT
jgi:hypothetical protein